MTNTRTMLLLAATCLLGWAATAAVSAPRGGSLESRVMSLERTCRDLRKSLEEGLRRTRARDMLLAEWFDEYHSDRGRKWRHRNAVRRTR